MDLRTDTDEYDLSERPLFLKEAAAHLGISERYFLDIRKKYSMSFEVCAWRGRRPVFYRKHISNLKEAFEWQRIEATQRKPRVGRPSGKTVITKLTSTYAEDAYASALEYAT